MINTKRHKLLKKRWIAMITAAIAAVIVVAVLFFYSYTQNQIYEESVSQLEEVSNHLIEKLEIKLDLQWDYLTKFHNSLHEKSSYTEEEAVQLLVEQETILSPVGSSILLRLIDSDGCYYTDAGRQGMWTGIDQLTDADRQCFLISNWLNNSNYMAFCNRVDHGLTVDGHEIKYIVLLRSMDDMLPYFQISAYGGRNLAYITDYSGRVLAKTGSLEGIEFVGLNIYHGMRESTFPHVESFEEIIEKGANGDTICTDVLINDNRYYAVYNVLLGYDYAMLLLVSADDVATSATQMVTALFHVYIAFTLGIIVLVVTVCLFTLNTQKNKNIMLLQAENERILENKNHQLEELQKITEQALEDAKEATKAKSQFLANMSHDIRTPMNAIVGVTRLMENSIQDPERLLYYLNKLQRSSQYMLGLINDMLDMSKIEAGEVRINLEPLKLADQIGQIDSIIRSQASEKDQEFTIRINNLSHEYLTGDSVRIRQVYLNLLTNAVKYTQNGGKICFEITELPSEKPDHAKLFTTVTDNGYGMSEEFLKHIFEAFTREVNSTTNKIQGTGLGMCITKNIVDLMGGTITVQSELGKGSRFEVMWELPIDTSVEREACVDRVLLLSAEEELVQNVRAALSNMPIQLDVASDADHAAEVLEANPGETIILDDTNAENCGALRQKAKDSVLIFCCDYAHWEKFREKLSDGAVDGFVARPFFYENFAVAVEQVRTRGQQKTPENHSVLKGRHFLCAEDNELNAEILEALLKMHGATCVIYPNGEELVSAFASVVPGDFDAILMDVQMPVMNGLDATRAIRNSENPLGKTIPIIAMTANAFDSDVRDCLKAGMDTHIAKPLDISVLERVMQEMSVKKS